VFSDEHAAGRYTSEIPGGWHLSSTPQPHKRWLPTVSLLPSGPRPVSAVKIGRPVLQQALKPATSKQDGASQLRSQARTSLINLPLASSPAYRRFRVTGNAGLPGLAHQPYNTLVIYKSIPTDMYFFPTCRQDISSLPDFLSRIKNL